MLVLVGPNWSTARLHNELDWIRIEVEEANKAFAVYPTTRASSQLGLPDEAEPNDSKPIRVNESALYSGAASQPESLDKCE